MRVCATSDLHGFLPDIPPCDLILISGDLPPINSHKLPFQRRWLKEVFTPWLVRQRNLSGAREAVMTWGNHDFIGQEEPGIKWGLPCEVLVDEVFDFEGYRIWGSPWTKRFFDWAFNMDPEDLAKLHSSIPKCDIVITHGPPYGFGDRAPRMTKNVDPITGGRIFDGYENVGSPELINWIVENEPLLVSFGHIHCGQSTRRLGNTIIANVSHVSEGYRPTLAPQVFEIDKPTA